MSDELRRAATLALSALDRCGSYHYVVAAKDALRAALAAPAPGPADEPVAWREHVEQRIRSWQWADHTADETPGLEWFMEPRVVEDLIGYVCSPLHRPAPAKEPT